MLAKTHTIRPWRPLSFYGRHGAPPLAPPHAPVSRHAGQLLYAVALGVGHHGGRRMTADAMVGWCVFCFFVVCVLRRNTKVAYRKIGDTLSTR
jgi:hypothetical protein